MRNSRALLGLIVLALVATTAIGLTLTFKKQLKPPNAGFEASAQTREGDARQFSDRNRVRASALSGHSRSLLSNLGDRLERPGNERAVYTGSLKRADDSLATPFMLVWELPGRLRLEDYGRQQITVFDGETVSRTQAGSATFEDELMETLIYDSAEHLFLSQMQGAATRFLGSRFKLKAEEAAQPVYDIFEVTEANKARNDSTGQTRQYLFNSDTQVLELIKYPLMKNGVEVPVEVHLEGWRRIGPHLFPSRIVRLESGAPVFTLAISTATVTPRIDDGIFLTSRPN
jgi:hypothetical protein